MSIGCRAAGRSAAVLDEAGGGGREEGGDAREEEELDRQGQGSDCDVDCGGALRARVQCAVDNRRVLHEDLYVDGRVECDDPDRDCCLGQAEGQDTLPPETWSRLIFICVLTSIISFKDQSNEIHHLLSGNLPVTPFISSPLSVRIQFFHSESINLALSMFGDLGSILVR